MSPSFAILLVWKTRPTTPTESPTPEPTETPVSVPSVSSPEVTESTAVSEPETVVVPAGEAPAEPVATTLESETTQTGGNEPLPEPTPAQPEPTKEERPVTKRDDTPTAKPVEKVVTEKEKLGLLRQMARATIQLRREKKLTKIMTLLASQAAVTNDEVERLLHVSYRTPRPV